MKVIIKPSTKYDKKYMAIFTDKNNKTKTTFFGQRGANDFTITGDKERRRLYRNRHRKDLNTGDYKRAGFLSRYILWGDSKSIRKNINSYKKRFNLN